MRYYEFYGLFNPLSQLQATYGDYDRKVMNASALEVEFENYLPEQVCHNVK